MTSFPPNTAHHADVIVIGAGVLGTFHAYYAAKRGYKTFLLEKNVLPQAASTRNFGMIVQTIVETDNEWANFARDSREIYLTLQQEHDITVRPTGSLYIASTETERLVLQEFAQLYTQAYHCIYFTAEEACARYSFIQTAYCQGALLFPDDLTIDPQQMLRRLIPALTQKGLIDYFPQTLVVGVESQGQTCSVKDAQGNIFTAQRVIICSGADYRTLFPAQFKQSRLRICKLQMMQTVSQGQTILPHSILSGLSILRYPAFKSCPSYRLLQEQAVDERLRHYGIHLLFKQSADGTVIIGDSHEYREIAKEEFREETTSTLINDAILAYGKRMISLPTWNIENLWNGYYLIHPERGIYTEQIDDNIHIVTGIAGKGMSTGPGFVRSHIDAVLI
jgi:D-hydroxyproline dehydrogenase subunit beta